MKKNIVLFYFIYIVVIDQFRHYCQAGLLDLILHRDDKPHLFNFNNNRNQNQVGQNMYDIAHKRRHWPFIKNPFESNDDDNTNLNENNSSHVIGANSDDLDYSSQSNNPIPQTNTGYNDEQNYQAANSPTNSIQNYNVQNVISGSPDHINPITHNYYKGNDVFNNNMENQQIPTNKNNKRHSILPLINDTSNNSRYSTVPSDFKSNQSINGMSTGSQLSNRNNANNLNIPKIVDDLNRINNIVNAIKKEKNSQNNVKTPTVLPSLNNFQIRPIAILTIPKENDNQDINNNSFNTNKLTTQHSNTKTTTTTSNPTKSDQNNNQQIHETIGSSTKNTTKSGKEEETKNEEKSKPQITAEDEDEHNNNVLKPFVKRKFFVQVTPVIPEYKKTNHDETVYYVK